MASPAGASPLLRPVDPSRKSHYTIQLSDAITGSGTAGTFTSVRFNHKPKQSSSQRTTTISPPDNGQQYSLTVKDTGDGKAERYSYKGQKTSSSKSYVLIFDPAKQTCTLEPLSAAYAFNLTSTPTESSAAKLAQQYPQIHFQKDSKDGSGDDLFGEAGDDLGLDDGAEDSPYDYRKFIPSQASMSPPDVLTGSATNTPRSETSQKATPARKSAATSTKKAATTKAAKAAAAAAPLRKVERAAAPAKKVPTPSVRLERRASTLPGDKGKKEEEKVKRPPSPALPPPPPAARYSDDEHEFEFDFGDGGSRDADGDADSDVEMDNHVDADKDEFTIENEEPVRKPKSLGQALLDHAQGGPISLRSAANSASPSSRLHTPLHARTQPEDDDVIDFGDAPAGDFDDDDAYGEDEFMDEDADGEADHDVEPMDIGPPAHEPAQKPQESKADDDEDDLDEFEQEMMQGLLNSDSESEEE